MNINKIEKIAFYSKTCSVIYCVESEGGLLGKLRSLTNERELSGRKGEKGGKGALWASEKHLGTLESKTKNTFKLKPLIMSKLKIRTLNHKNTKM
jgi:hypothetical protein